MRSEPRDGRVRAAQSGLKPGGAWLRALALAALFAAGCGSDERVVTSSRTGSSIALLSDGRIAVVDPDQGSVSLVDATTLEPLARIDVGGEPHALLEIAPGRLLVTNYRAGELVLVDTRTPRVIARNRICAGPWGLGAPDDGAFVAVACEWSGSVVLADPKTLAASELARGFSRPRALAVEAESVVVAGFTGGALARVELSGSLQSISLVPPSAPYRPALREMSANLAQSMLVLDHRAFVGFELVNHTGNQQAEKVADDYGSVSDGNPKINPALEAFELRDGSLVPTPMPVSYAVYDGGSRVFSGPSAVAAVDAGHVLVSHLSTKNVALIELDAEDPAKRAVRSYAVGAGPHGIAVDPARGLAWVDNAFDGSISRLDLRASSGGVLQPELTRVRGLPEVYSSAALAGRKLFYEAANPHVTPSGVVACGTCHPDGGDDGLRWFIHTPKIPLKRRRTPNLANARSNMAPFHWDGQFQSMHELALATITDLMAGDALLVDVDGIQPFIDEIVKPAVAEPGDAASIERGRELFLGKADCAKCHPNPTFTDAHFHAVLSPMSLSNDDVVTQIDTPGLAGVFLGAPYFHDGRANDLEDLLTRPDAEGHGNAAGLGAEERADLAVYLRSL